VGFNRRIRAGAFVVLWILVSITAAVGRESALIFRSSILDAEVRDVEVSGSFAYTLFTSGLLVIDIADPSMPVVAGRHFFEEAPQDIRLMGDAAVIAVGSGGIRVVDITDPDRIVLRGGYDTGGEATGLDLAGDTLYVADGLNGLQVLSLADPGAPEALAELVDVSPAEAVDVSGEYAYLAALGEGLIVVRISDFPVLEEVARLPLGHTAKDIRYFLSPVYVADMAGLASVSVAEPESPSLISYQLTAGRSLDLFIDPPLLHLAADVEGFHILDVEANPDVPVWRSTFDTPDDARGIASTGGIVAVADDLSGLILLDITEPSNPESLGIYPSAGENHGGVFDGSWAYVAQGANGVAFVDVGDLERPDVRRIYSEGISFVHDVEVNETRLALANHERGLMILDISNPADPSLLGEIQTGRDVTAVEVNGPYAYVVDNDFHAIDISDPIVPIIASSYITPCATVGVALSGNLAFVADRECGVHSIDISNPGDSLRILHTIDTSRFATGVAVRDTILFIGDSDGGLIVVRFDGAGQMEEIGGLDPGAPVVAVAVAGDVAFLGLEGGEVVAVDVENPSMPEVIDRFPTPGSSLAIGVDGERILVGDRTSTIFLEYASTTGIDSGIGLGPTTLPEELLLPNRPNPFNPSTLIPFRVPPTGDAAPEVQLRVCSLRGRHVRWLFRGRAIEGEHAVTWNGTTASGTPVPSGVYICILRIGDRTIARKMLLVR
jgi:hypothetical protein